MKAVGVLVIVAMTLGMVGCLEDMSTTQKTTAGGALLGAAVGGVIGSKSANAGKGILIGAAAGAAGGYLVGKLKSSKEQDQPNTVECPYCKSVNQLPPEAKAGDVIECFNCEKRFQLQ